VDLNRSGVALMEIVSKPDLRSSEEAKEYLARLVAANHNHLYVYRGLPGADLTQFVARRPDRTMAVGNGDNIEAGDFFPFRRCQLLLAAESKNIYRLAPEG